MNPIIRKLKRKLNLLHPLRKSQAKIDELKERICLKNNDIFELTKILADQEARLKGKIWFCKQCDGLIYKLGERYLHQGICDLDDGVIVRLDVAEELLQKRLQGVIEREFQGQTNDLASQLAPKQNKKV